MQAAVYLRISEDRTGRELGVARQRKDCLKLCSEKGWEPVEYVDNDISASNGKIRPAYQRMLADIREGLIAAVVCWDADRLHRQPRELEDFIDLADAQKVALATVGGYFDLSTPTGRGNARMKGVFARMEIEQKAERQKSGARQKAERGEPSWSNAFGYRPGPDGPEPDPETAPLVREAYAHILAGGSIADITRRWNDLGKVGLTGRPWTAPAVSLFLKKPRNAGLRSYAGEIIGNATWAGLVSEATWRDAQAILRSPGRKPGPKTCRRHLLTGVVGCGRADCDGTFIGFKGPKGVQAYRCRKCLGTAIRAHNLEPFLYKLVGARLAKDDAKDLLRIERDPAEAERVRTELNGLYDRKIAIGVEIANGLDMTVAKAAVAEVNEQIANLEKTQQDQEQARKFAGLDLGKPQVVEQIKQLSPDRFRTILVTLGMPIVDPIGRGHGKAVPARDRVRVPW
jgi:DNA invertase Pin-like site-specific DNA recombinase